MTTPPEGQIVFNVPGLTITVPDQGYPIEVVRKGLPELVKMPGTAQFKPIRAVANVAVKDLRNGNYVTHFEPPIKLDVGYITQDLFEAALVARNLKLAYWDGTTWVLFNLPENNFSLLPPSTGAIGEVYVHDWVGDPPVAWGS